MAGQAMEADGRGTCAWRAHLTVRAATQPQVHVQRRLLPDAGAVQVVTILELAPLVEQPLLVAGHAPLARGDTRLYVLNQLAWLHLQREHLA